MKILIYSFIALLSSVGATAPGRSRDIPTCIPSVLRRAIPQDTLENPQPVKASPAKTSSTSAAKSRSKLSKVATFDNLKFSLPKGITNIMQLPIFERAVILIKRFETLHKPVHWPYVGYGHQVQPSDPYRKGVQLTEAQADALLRKDFRKFCHMYAAFGKDSILLGALAYNCGPGVVNKSSVLKKLKRGESDIAASYIAHCRYKGKPHKGLYSRRLAELSYLFIP